MVWRNKIRTGLLQNLRIVGAGSRIEMIRAGGIRRLQRQKEGSQDVCK